MPGGQLSYWVYGKLGGEKSFADFWMHLGLPVVAFIGMCYFFVVDRGFATVRQWLLGSVALICLMIIAVACRMIT